MNLDRNTLLILEELKTVMRTLSITKRLFRLTYDSKGDEKRILCARILVENVIGLMNHKQLLKIGPSY
ncbi:CLUMA_CG006444, isoform A [Clunio marinus]|uniref:CLUMA_CG006444, isoform A n=1 Tax=Clunio marinus TaxID=568069 RepID=A0A1J1HYT6_9DIPT|nr:CLUMA_CG006444, isoform A [Clunio marinus]